VQKERTDALAAAGVADGSRYSRPGDDGPVGGDRMMGTGALEPVVGLREQRRRKIAEAEAAAVAAAERDAAAARGDAEEEPAASPKALAPPAADSAVAACLFFLSLEVKSAPKRGGRCCLSVHIPHATHLRTP